MANTGKKPLKSSYKYIRLVGTREALNVFFQNTEIVLASEIQGIGRELLQALQVAVRIDMPLVINFQGVHKISSAMIGKLVLLNKKSRSERVNLQFREMADSIHNVIRRVTRNLPLDDLPLDDESTGPLQ